MTARKSAQMAAVICRETGDPANVALQKIPVPEPAMRQVRIRIRAAGIAFANLLVLQGRHQNTPQTPFIPGTEIAGEIDAVGPRITNFKPGDRVFAGIAHGGFADFAVAPARDVRRLSDSLDFAAGTQMATIYPTAFAGLKWYARLKSGETLLVHGAAGASGLAAIDIGRRLNARIIATVGSDTKAHAAAAKGADHVIRYDRGPFRDAVLELTAGRGANVVFDPVGGAVFEQSLRCMAPEGRILPMGFAGGGIPQIPANILLVKNITVIGLYWGYHMGWARQPVTAPVRRRVNRLFATLRDWADKGHIHPETDSRFPLADFQSALARVRERRVIGKAVLEP